MHPTVAQLLCPAASADAVVDPSEWLDPNDPQYHDWTEADQCSEFLVALGEPVMFGERTMQCTDDDRLVHITREWVHKLRKGFRDLQNENKRAQDSAANRRCIKAQKTITKLNNEIARLKQEVAKSQLSLQPHHQRPAVPATASRTTASSAVAAASHPTVVRATIVPMHAQLQLLPDSAVPIAAAAAAASSIPPSRSRASLAHVEATRCIVMAGGFTRSLLPGADQMQINCNAIQRGLNSIFADVELSMPMRFAVGCRPVAVYHLQSRLASSTPNWKVQFDDRDTVLLIKSAWLRVHDTQQLTMRDFVEHAFDDDAHALLWTHCGDAAPASTANAAWWSRAGLSSTTHNSRRGGLPLFGPEHANTAAAAAAAASPSGQSAAARLPMPPLKRPWPTTYGQASGAGFPPQRLPHDHLSAAAAHSPLMQPPSSASAQFAQPAASASSNAAAAIANSASRPGAAQNHHRRRKS